MKKMSWHKTTIGALALMTVGLLVPALVQGQSLEQSPINIQTEDLREVVRLPVLHFIYGTRASLNVVNTGSPGEEATVRADVLFRGGQLRVAGVNYNLLQFHWHTPAEHLINGEEFPLEMHLVHQAADGNLLVVGIFIKQGKPNTELGRIFSVLPAAAGDTTAVSAFNLRQLLPEDRESFRYEGSLTTPPFSEGVRWVVLEEPIEMSRQQIQTFMNLFPEGNSREVQPLNDRTVLTDVEFEGDD